MIKAVVIVGPTAVGKSAFAMEAAGERFEIVSADSVQVYRYMDIGSAKPAAADRKAVPHHCIDLVDPDNPFTAGDYCREARAACEEIVVRGKLPLVVGGAGLYIDSFFFGLSEIPSIDTQVKEGLKEEMERKGTGALYHELSQADPVFAGSIHPNDRQRILRGLEVYRGTGTPLSGYFGRSGTGSASEKTLFIGLEEDRGVLAARIDRRVDAMMKGGFVQEVAALRGRGYSPGLKSMKSIGYAEMHEYLDGALSLDEAVDRIKRNTKKYAKRQMTWFRKNGRMIWFRAADPGPAKDVIARWADEQ